MTALGAGSAGAQAPGPRPKPAAPPAPAQPDPAYEAARTAFEALPEAERKGLQDALIWTGDYTSVVAGTFGRRTFEALNAFRARIAAAAADPLEPRLRAAILAAGEAARKAARFTVKPDPASGAVLGLPERWFTKRAPVPGGTRFQSADGRVTLESRSFPPGETDLDALFERATAALNDRKVTYKLKRPDFIVVTAETAGGKSYIRYAAGPEGIRGFALGYDKALAGEIDRLVIAIANSFVPFPNAAAPAASALAAPAPAAPAAAAKLAPAAAAASAPAAQAPAPQVPAATGIGVAPGRVLTAAAALEGCAAPRIGGMAARVVASDPGRGLALLESSAARAVAALPARPNPVAEGDALVVVAADAGGVSVAAGSGSAAGGVFAPLQPGSAGAPVLDRAGALAGLVARFPAAPRLVAGVMPPTSLPLVPGSAVAAFLSENGIAPAPSGAGAGVSASLGAVAAPVSGAVLGIGCGR
ncbi:serine protease [Methylobacterium planeticum]|uniref:Serine protease n=1 Tax=Methylobacterium planeticum TaxID=2615211 RepID=A0A6N6MZG9_9HYPH|nr:serine protease [Methylobacterium planeticum]